MLLKTKNIFLKSEMNKTKKNLNELEKSLMVMIMMMIIIFLMLIMMNIEKLEALEDYLNCFIAIITNQ